MAEIAVVTESLRTCTIEKGTRICLDPYENGGVSFKYQLDPYPNGEENVYERVVYLVFCDGEVYKTTSWFRNPHSSDFEHMDSTPISKNGTYFLVEESLGIGEFVQNPNDNEFQYNEWKLVINY